MPDRLTALGLVLALGAVAAVALASCGGGDDAQLLPGETAREITANLDTVKLLADEGDCAGAEGAAEQVSAQVEELEGVDRELQRALRAGAVRLNEVVAGCEEAATEAVAPARIPETTEEAAGKRAEEERRREEREREKEEREAEREEAREEEVESGPTGPPAEVPPPHSEGQGEGPGSGEGPAESPSGGVSPGSAVGEGG